MTTSATSTSPVFPPGQYRRSISLAYPIPFLCRIKVLAMHSARPGTDDLIVYAPSALSRSIAKLSSVREGDRLTTQDLTLSMSTLHSIRGTVLEHGTRRSGVAVRLRRPSQALHDVSAAVIRAAIIPVANTDESGAFLLTLVPSRSYRTAAGPIDQPAAIPASIPVPDSTPDSAPRPLHHRRRPVRSPYQPPRTFLTPG